MNDRPPSNQRLHDMRGSLNGLGLQVEVLALAFARSDPDMHERALSAARDALADLARQLDELRSESFA